MGNTDAKTTGIVILTIIFVACYVVALFGWYTFTPNEKVVSQLAPIVAVIIGYYFGRLPSEKNENSLKDQANKKDQEAKQAREEQSTAEAKAAQLAEKVKNAREALTSGATATPSADLAITLGPGGSTPHEAVRGGAAAALRILQS
jgi:hypothetical protein